MYSCRTLSVSLLCVLSAILSTTVQAAQPGPAAKVLLVGGNGQIVEPNFPTTVPLAIQVTDAAGIPVAGVPVSWSLSCSPDDYACNTNFTGTLIQPSAQTDSNGIASTNYNQTYVPPGESYVQATVTASTAVGSVPFRITATAPFTGNSLTFQPYISVPGPLGTVTGSAGSTLPAALQVNVSPATGFFAGQGIANIGVRVVDSGTLAPTAAAACNAPGGTVLTNASGVASCDLLVGSTPGTYHLSARVGEQQNPQFNLVIGTGQACTITISPLSQSVAGAGGSGFINVTAGTGCTWTATSNASFLTVTSGTSGTGNGTVAFTAGTNSGPARSGTISIGGQTFTVNQSANGSVPGPLTITSSPTLPGGIQGQSYSATITATGGTGVYGWAVVSGSLPPGIGFVPNLNTVLLSGAPTTPGTYSFTVNVSDSGGNSLSQAFSIAVTSTAASGGLTITTTTLANGVVGTPYNQPLSYSQSSACGTPFNVPSFTLTSGTLPPGLSLQNNSITGTPGTAGTYPFTVVLANSFCQSTPVSLTITIFGTGTSTVLNANPASLTFNATLNAAAPAAQQIAISSTGASVPLSVSTNVSWISATLSQAATPATLTVSVINYQAMAAGTYQGSITVTTSGNNTIVIPVTLTINAVTSTLGLSVLPTSLTYNLPSNTYSQQVLSILGTNNNSTVPFLASATTTTGANWLGLVLTAGATPQTTLAGSTPANLVITVNTANLPAGRYQGSVIIQQSGTGFSITIPVSLSVTPVTLNVDTQSLAFTFVPGVTPPAAQTINLLSSIPIPVNVTTTTAAGGNWLFTTASGSPNPTAITVSVNPVGLARGTYNGTVIITPQDTTIPAIKVPVTLTIGAGAGPVVNGVVNAASNIPGPIAPGEFIAIYGTGLSSSTPALLALTGSGLISTTLNSTQVTFDGVPAPLIYVSPTQVNAIVPYEVFGRARTQMQVQYNGNVSAPVDLGVAATAPGIFLCLDCQPSGQAAAINQDNTINSVGNGAQPGSVVTLFATGEGQTNPAGTTGAITGSTTAQPLQPVTVRIGGLPAQVVYAGSAPSLAEGVLQVNVVIPASVPRGTTVDVMLTVGDATSNTAKIAIAQ